MSTPRYPDRRSSLASLAFAACATAVSAQRPSDVEARVAEFEYVSLFDIAGGQDLTGPYLAAALADRVEALARDWSTSAVRGLLSDAGSRTRAIALVVMHEQLGHRALPAFVTMFDDDGAAPPQREGVLGAVPGEKLYRDRPQTVGGIAQAIVSSYLPTSLTERYAGSSRMIGKMAIRRAFRDYMRTRHHREHSLVRLQLRLTRASGVTNPMPSDRIPAVRAFRRELDAVPSPARDWYLLALGTNWHQTGRQHLATEEELVGAAKSLGSDAMLRLLRGYLPADGESPDPDIDPDLTAAKYGPVQWEPLVEFVLRHGGELISADRCDELLEIFAMHELENGRGGHVGMGRWPVMSGYWFAAAAELQPERAAAHFAAGFARLPKKYPVYQRARGHHALRAWKQLGASGERLARDWFFGESPQRDFVDRLALPENAPLLWSILRDPRIAELGDSEKCWLFVSSVEHLPREARPSEDEMRSAWQGRMDGKHASDRLRRFAREYGKD